MNVICPVCETETHTYPGEVLKKTITGESVFKQTKDGEEYIEERCHLCILKEAIINTPIAERRNKEIMTIVNGNSDAGAMITYNFDGPELYIQYMRSWRRK